MAATAKNEEQIALARRLNHVPWCEEYEKMISGMLYNSLVPELDTARSNIRRACHEYNSNFPPDNATLQQERLARLKNMLGYVEGEEVYMEPPIHLDYGCNIRVGDRFYSNFNLTILDCGLVTFGDRVMIGPNVSIFAATHETEVQSRRDYIEYTRPVTIGDDVWIGGHVVILPGVDIGEGCTIAAGSMVTKSIPAWSVAMGSPAKVVKKVTPLEPVKKEQKKEKS